MLYNVVLISATQQCESADIYIYPLPFEPPFHPLSHPSRSPQSTKMSSLRCNSNFPLAICFTHYNVYMSVLLSIRPTLFSPPHCVHKSFLYVCVSVPALQIWFLLAQHSMVIWGTFRLQMYLEFLVAFDRHYFFLPYHFKTNFFTY